MSHQDNKDQEDNYKKAQDGFKVEKAPQIDLLVDTDSF